MSRGIKYTIKIRNRKRERGEEENSKGEKRARREQRGYKIT